MIFINSPTSDTKQCESAATTRLQQQKGFEFMEAPVRIRYSPTSHGVCVCVCVCVCEDGCRIINFDLKKGIELLSILSRLHIIVDIHVC
jgi:hypothetical protein